MPEGYRSEQPLTVEEILVQGADTTGLASSLFIHQLTPSGDVTARQFTDLTMFALEHVNSGESMGAEPPPEILEEMAATFPGVRTVAEVAVPGSAESDADILAALDIALEHVRFVQRVVAAATERPVRLISRATLPPSVPAFSGVVHIPGEGNDPQRPSFEAMVEFRIPDCAPPTALGVRSEPMSEDELMKLELLGARLGRGDPLYEFVDLRREAMVQRHFDGNARMTVIALAAAGEVLLDTMLLHLLWEEHADPVDVPAYFDRAVGHTARVTQHFPPRLGGQWSSESASAAGAYLRDVVRLRHRVIHAGHEPTATELDAAWRAMFDMERFLGDRLASDRALKRYTRTANTWMGQRGLERRGRWTRHVQELVNDPAEPNWSDSFRHWRRHVERALDPAAPAPGSSPEGLMLYAERLLDDTVRWVLHDPQAAHAAVVKAEDVRGADQVQATEAWLASVASSDVADRRVAMFLDSDVPSPLEWTRDDLVFPELAVFPATKTQPPAGT